MATMDSLKHFISHNSSFRRQLLSTVIVGVVALSLGASLTTAWLQSNKMRSQLLEQGQKIAENFASQSVLALLYSSKENAMDAARAILAFPNVRYVSILNNRNKILLQTGNQISWLPNLDHQKGKEQKLAYNNICEI